MESPIPTTQTSKRPWQAAILWPFAVLLFLPCCFAASGLYIAINSGLNLADPWLNLEFNDAVSCAVECGLNSGALLDSTAEYFDHAIQHGTLRTHETNF